MTDNTQYEDLKTRLERLESIVSSHKLLLVEHGENLKELNTVAVNQSLNNNGSGGGD